MWKTLTPQQVTRQFPLPLGSEHLQKRVAGSVTLDWQLLSEDEPEHAAVVMPDIDAAPRADTRGRSVRAIAGLLLVLGTSAALYLWRMAEAGAQILDDELRATVAAAAVRDPHAATVQVQAIAYHGETASVLVETTQVEPGGQTNVVRQRSVYQPTAAGWMRVPPGPDALGAPQMKESACCAYFYRAIDAAAMENVAGALDAAYVGLRQDYGLPAAHDRVIVEIRTDPPPYPSVCYRRDHLCIASPALAALPVDLAEAEALQLWLLNALAYQARWEAIEIAPFQYGWQYAAHALPRMTLRQHSARVAAWETDLARWLYGVAARTPRSDGQALAQDLARLCDTHRTLTQLPHFDGIDSLQLCSAPAEWTLQDRPPDHLRDLIMPDTELMVTQMSWMDAVGFQTVLDYVVATYGRAALPALVVGFRRYDTWGELIPAVFGISAAEFETGWQHYLVLVGGSPDALASWRDQAVVATR